MTEEETEAQIWEGTSVSSHSKVQAVGLLALGGEDSGRTTRGPLLVPHWVTSPRGLRVYRTAIGRLGQCLPWTGFPVQRECSLGS